MAFTHLQGALGRAATSPITITLTTNPVQGSVVCVGICFGSVSQPTITVKDSNNNNYVQTPNSPSGTVGFVFMFYLIAPVNATKTLTVTTSSNAATAAWAEEFTVTNGNAIFDVDKIGTGTGTTFNLPSLTTAGQAELLFATANPNTSAITAPAAGGTSGGWTGAAGGIDAVQTGGDSEYIVSSAANPQAINFTAANQSWSGMAMSFYVQPAPALYLALVGPHS